MATINVRGTGARYITAPHPQRAGASHVGRTRSTHDYPNHNNEFRQQRIHCHRWRRSTCVAPERVTFQHPIPSSRCLARGSHPVRRAITLNQPLQRIQTATNSLLSMALWSGQRAHDAQRNNNSLPSEFVVVVMPGKQRCTVDDATPNLCASSAEFGPGLCSNSEKTERSWAFERRPLRAQPGARSVLIPDFRAMTDLALPASFC